MPIDCSRRSVGFRVVSERFSRDLFGRLLRRESRIFHHDRTRASQTWSS